MRVVAGTARGRRLEAPDGRGVRPTGDRVREALFNRLGSWDVVVGAVVVDLFAGTGALGIEAWSRGAAAVTFVERDRRHVQVLRRNLGVVGFRHADVVVADATTWRPAGRVDLVLADPPYAFDAWPILLADLTADLVVAESDRALEAPPGWELIRSDRYGQTVVTCLEPSAIGEADDSSG